MTMPLPAYDLVESPSLRPREESTSRSRPTWGDGIARTLTIWLCILHGVGVWTGMGGLEGIRGSWPNLVGDHGVHYQHGLVARQFLRATGMNAGYDPSFMSGYPSSILSDLSSTLSDLAMLASGDRPVLGYKLHAFGGTAITPWLIAMAVVMWRGRPLAAFFAVGFYLTYFWTDFPIKYASLGMINYLISAPLGLIATAALARYCEAGGLSRWALAWLASSAVFLVHLTSPMVVGPAALLAYGVAVARSGGEGAGFPISRHLGLWLMAPLILAVNAFWLVPGLLLRSTMGGSTFAFSHPEGVMVRLRELVWEAPPIEVVLLGLGIFGVAVLWRRGPIASAALGGLLMVGFGWGYLAGASRSLDFLQPGRHTYVFYSAASVGAGIGLAEALAKLRSPRGGRLDGWAWLALVFLAVRIVGPAIDESIRDNALPQNSLLTSKPTERMVWLVDKIRKHVRPGTRLLYEETGVSQPGQIDPFRVRHVSPVLPELTGVEVLGGPYLHDTVTTNFTQFGENRLFGNKDWDRDFFARYAQLYRPEAICCWSLRARAFCRSNPDLIQILEDDGTMMIGRVIGFEGPAIRGSAQVEASPNRLIVRSAVAGSDGLVVLRYHAAPYLKASPPVAIEPILLEGDPVPFIGFRPSGEPVTIELALPHRF